MNRSAPQSRDRSKKLYEVLLEEYETLQLLDAAKIDEVKAELNQRYSGLNWHDFKMNDWIQANRLKKIHRAVLDEQSELLKQNLSPSALCLSGGGIRSATFSLGILQALSKYGLLDKFDYLSTVSGGGYIGSWLSAWIDRAGSVEKVQAALCRDQANPYLFELRDFDLDFQDSMLSLKKLRIPEKVDEAAKDALGQDELRSIEEMFGKLNRIIELRPENIEVMLPENHDLKILFKDFCKTLNRFIISERVVKTDQTREFCQTLTRSSLSSVEQRRKELERAIAPLLKIPARFKPEEFSSELNETVVRNLATQAAANEESLKTTRTELENQHESISREFAAEKSERKKEILAAEFKRNADRLYRLEKDIKAAETRQSFISELFEKLTTKKDETDEKKAAQDETFGNRLLCELNLRIERAESPIDRLKVRKSIYDNLEPLIIPYSESDLLQNSEKANTNHEPEELTHLRTYSNYMSPKLGLFSTDSFSLFTLYIRNLLLNWLVFVPLIAAFLLIPKMYLWVVEKQAIYKDIDKVLPQKILAVQSLESLAAMVPLPSLNFGAVLIGLIITATLAVVLINKFRPSLSEESFFKQNYGYDAIGGVTTAEKRILVLCFLPIAAVAFIIPVFWRWHLASEERDLYGRPEFIKLGLIIFVGGFLLARGAFLINRQYRKWKSGDSAVRSYTRADILNIFFELLTSIVCGIFGGIVLHFGAERLNRILSAIPKDRIETFEPGIYVTAAPVIFLTSFLIAATLFVGIASKITDDMDREWMNRFGAMLMKLMIGWSIISTTVILGDKILTDLVNDELTTRLLASVGGISGALTLILGFSSKSTEEKKESDSSFKSKIISIAPQIAAPVFLLFLIGLIAWLTGKLVIYSGVENPWIWFAVFAVVGILAGFVININKFSLHAMYRERLIRTYLGASRLAERFKTANSFTDLDLRDNVELKYLRQKPYHIVNMTLNLVKARNLKWQNRKAESFTASALYCGSSNMGNGTGHFRSSEKYASNPHNDRSISLGTALAVSGAAASPNMGYFTVSTAVSFLMTMFNIRLGWWFGNPGNQGRGTWTRASPEWSPKLLVAEALSGTTDTYPYIYVSDGGHFENLGIYEMALRRCRLIIAVDSTADPDFTFSDLGNAIHKIRVDMGIPIVFRKPPRKGIYCAVADLKYSEVDGTKKENDGILIYIKPSLRGDEPIDILQYQIKNSAFPHESTADQMYSETQFESYRGLGFHTVDSIAGGLAGEASKCDELNEFVKRAVEFNAMETKRAEERANKPEKN